jgi:hypothetical protein
MGQFYLNVSARMANVSVRMAITVCKQFSRK